MFYKLFRNSLCTMCLYTELSSRQADDASLDRPRNASLIHFIVYNQLIGDYNHNKDNVYVVPNCAARW